MNLAPGLGGMNEVLLAVETASPARSAAAKTVMRWRRHFLRIRSLMTASEARARYFPEMKLLPLLSPVRAFPFPCSSEAFPVPLPAAFPNPSSAECRSDSP